MGSNAAIKRYEAKRAGQQSSLFDDARSASPVVFALLESPWVMRGSELLRDDGGSYSTKRVEEPVHVRWDAERAAPASFIRGEREHPVESVAQTWATERRWWDREAHVSRRFWRVLGRDGVYDLVYDRVAGGWYLAGIQD